jgi:hypothetical protein
MPIPFYQKVPRDPTPNGNNENVGNFKHCSKRRMSASGLGRVKTQRRAIAIEEVIRLKPF